MPKASVTRQIDREKQKLIDFVLDIEKYPEFIPFCIDSKVYKSEDKEDEIAIIADLTIGRKPFVDTYKSDVRYDKKNDSIHVTNIGGPLKHLQNNWKFTQKENYTEVQFDVDFEIKNKFLNLIMEKSFQFGLNKIADAFQDQVIHSFLVKNKDAQVIPLRLDLDLGHPTEYGLQLLPTNALTDGFYYCALSKMPHPASSS